MNTRDFFQQLARHVRPDYRDLSVGELLVRAAGPGRDATEAFVALVCRRAAFVQQVCRRVIGQAEPAEDVAVDVFLALWRRRGLRNPAAVDAWLRGTAERLSCRYLRNRRRARAAQPALRERVEEPAPADRPAVRAEVVLRVRQALAELPQADRQVLQAFQEAEDEQRVYAAAARSLGMSEPAFRSRLSRARQRLEGLLRRYGLAPVVWGISLLAGLWDRAASAVLGRPLVARPGPVRVPGRWWLAGLTVAAGVAVGAGWLTRPDAPEDSPPPPDPAPLAAPAPPPARAESARERTERIFRAEVLPGQLDALREVFLGRGEIGLESLEFDGLWIKAVYTCRYLTTPPRTAAIELKYDTGSGETGVYADLLGTGSRKPINPVKPMTFFRDERTGREVTFRNPALDRALGLFDRLSPPRRAGQPPAPPEW